MRLKRHLYLVTGTIGLGLCITFLRGGSDQSISQTVSYTVRVDSTRLQSLQVEMRIKPVPEADVTLRMPRWSPGAYRIRRYPRNVHSFEVHDANGTALSYTHATPDSWTIKSTDSGLRVSYGVEVPSQPWSYSVSDSTYLLIEGPSTFMYVAGHRAQSTTVTYLLPPGWEVASPLATSPTSDKFYAPNYDKLIDAPAQVGKFETNGFSLKGVPIQLVFHGQANFDTAGFVSMVQKICDYQTGLFGEVPFERYVFYYNVLPGPWSGGGLEHANSATIGLSGDRLSASVSSAAEVTAHEFFHTWNVKRVFPKAFRAIDYQTEVRTPTLWFVEGVTSYYEALSMVRTGLWTPEAFWEEMEHQIEQLQRTTERRTVSVADASWRTWERGYNNPGVSFYNKGEVLGLLLDLRIRSVTHNRASLDDLLKRLNREFAREGRGYTNTDILALINRITGDDFTPFFRNYVSGTKELPYETAFTNAGFNVQISRALEASVGDITLVGKSNRVLGLSRTSSAYRAGLRDNDLLLKFDEAPIVSADQFHRLLQGKKPGESAILEIKRTGRGHRLYATVAQRETIKCEIWPKAGLSELQHSIQEGLLHANETLSTVSETNRKTRL